MKLSLRPGEKIYINGAVFSVDRRVSLQLLNDVTFLLESHVMQEAQATSPLRQVYFAIQTMLMDPEAGRSIKPSVLRMVEAISLSSSEAVRREALNKVAQSLESCRTFEALREVRGLYREDEGQRENSKRVTTCS